MKKPILLLAFLFTFSLFLSSCDKEEVDPNDPPANSTTLVITVKDDKGALVDGAGVRLFDDAQNWSDDKNPVTATVNTNASGVVSFGNLNPIQYYIMVEKGSLNNWFGTSETKGALTKNQTSTITIVIK